MTTKEKIDVSKQAITEIEDYIELLKMTEKVKTDYSKEELKKATEKLINSAISLLEQAKI